MKFKKTLAIMLSVFLVMSFCISAFAGDPETTTKKATIASVQDALNAVKNTLTDLIKEGKLPGGLTIDEIKKAIENALPDFKSPSTTSAENNNSSTKTGIDVSKHVKNIRDAVDKAFEADKSGSLPRAIVQAFLAQGRTYDEARSAFQELQDQGILSPKANQQIQRAIDAAEADDNSSVSTTKKLELPSITLPNVTLPSGLDGVKGFFEGILNKITGKGGNTPSSTQNANVSKANSNNNKSVKKTENSPKTGDIGLYAVAATAVIAGIGLVATKKKKEEK